MRGPVVLAAVLAMACTAAVPEGMVRIEGGEFWMGTDAVDGRDGEGPARKVTVETFDIGKTAVTNEQFRDFVRATKYKTDAEKYGWSFVFHAFVDETVKKQIKESPEQAPWWLPVKGAYWRAPFGPYSSIRDKLAFPATQISWNDAREYCQWKGLALPSEAQWEYAARGGLARKTYPWGDQWMASRMNSWQGQFPDTNTFEDGNHGVGPAEAYGPQNKYGLYNMIGNAWEWTRDEFRPVTGAPPQQEKQHVLRGGSYVDSQDGKTNHKLRVTTRMGNTADSGSDNLSFRCASGSTQRNKSEL